LDPIDQDAETGDWYITQYSTLRHINLMENKFEDDEDCLEELFELIDRCTNIAIVLNLNNFSEETRDRMKSLRPKIII